MKPYGPFSRCGRESCRLCNPVEPEEPPDEWPTYLLTAAFAVFMTIIVLWGVAA